MIEIINNISQKNQYGLLNYINFKTLIVFIIPFLICLTTANLFFKIIHKMIKQQNLDKNKIILSMGGIIIFIPWLLTTIIFCKLDSPVIIVLFAGIYFVVIGFFIDFFQLRQENINKKIMIAIKIISPIIFGLILSWLLFTKKIILYKENPLTLHIPFIKNAITTLSPFLYSIFIILILTLGINSFGSKKIKGVTAVPSVFIAITFSIFAYIMGKIPLQTHSTIPYIKDTTEITISLIALIGTLIAFVWFNSIPFRVYLGYSGKLMLAGILITSAIILKQELLFFIAAGTFTLEFLLIIIDKITKGNLKIMKILRQFEEDQKLNPQSIYILRYWIIAFIFSLISLSGMK